MQTLSEIKALLAGRGLQPRRRFGQNFLHDKNQLTRLVDAAEIVSGELVLEIGPGTGTLTETLVERGAEVVTVEIDRDLADIIDEQLGEQVTLVRGDCFERQRRLAPDVLDALGDRSFKLVANLPYQIASPLMAGLLIEHPACTGQWVTVQREVADRLIALPGGKTYGPLGIIVQALATVERIAVVKPGSFWPAPTVTSAMIAVRPRVPRPFEDAAAFGRFVAMLFGARRKQLGTTLGRDAALPDGVTAQQRPESLTVEQLVELWKLHP